MINKRVMPNKHLWWYDPELPKGTRYPSRNKRETPVSDSPTKFSPNRRKLYFHPSRKWKRYADLESRDIGYLTEVYPLRAIAQRYGLSTNTRNYWRDFILPEPFDNPANTYVKSYYWSRIQLVVVDTVLKYLERNGLTFISKTHVSCLELIDHGCEVLADYYEKVSEDEMFKDTDRFGVKRDVG